ncbi:MAG: sigma 54-interacting transcriptional regulator [Desulfobacterales bacterium]|jgi:transcriptional regulator of aroF, aroG, tyrA and aromatic amino acid transport
MNLKLELIFEDRVGIVADISTIIAQHGGNIASMEVVRHEDRAHVYLETEKREAAARFQDLFETLSKVDGLVQIHLINTLPQEERENRFQVVLDNISDGVVSIDREGKVTTINRVARQVLGCGDRNVVGMKVEALNLPDFQILKCLEDKKFSNVKKDLITASGRYHYFSTGRPIRDSEGQIIGAVEIARDMQEIKKLARSISDPAKIGFSDIIGSHPAIEAAVAFARKIAGTDTVVSIRGGSGTGKELFARAIHSEANLLGPFVPINCAALPEQLLESELLGYVGGAFTGGRKEGKPGLFEVAREGTVFLDEIGDMPSGSQAKILRVIQEKQVRRIGGSKEIPVQTRIITATNRNLERLVAQKKFRQDLYYRINVIPIHIPPLVERVEDIPLLVEHFMFQLAAKLEKPMHAITKEAMRKLMGHDWPGNVRELKNVVERAVFLAEGDLIDMKCIVFSHEIGQGLQKPQTINTSDQSVRFSLKERISTYEKQIVMETMQASRSIRQAARRLGVSHTALLNKLKKWKHKEPVAT